MKHPYKKGYHWSEYQRYADKGFTKSETAKLMGVSRQSVHNTSLKYRIEFPRKCNRGGIRNVSVEKVLWSSPDIREKWEKFVGKHAKVRTKKIVHH